MAAVPEAPAPPPPPDIPLAQPEIAFAARAAARPPETERPFPTTRRAIFFDVENTSRVQHIARVIDYLAVDRLGRRTDFVAVGNWRVIGHDTARLLAGHGAQLLHSAPSVGVKDWSDLRIAVAAGVWLGTARPGDVLEIISDDRAFDAVGDVATSLGIAFRRLSYRGLTGLPREAAPPPLAAVEPRVEPRGSRYRRGRRGGRGPREAPVVHAAPQPAHRQVAAEAHTAPHDELLGVARDLIGAAPNGAVTLDALANALKSRGFSRPPGSPRLITRLRRLRELSVSRSGHITLVDSTPAPPPVVEAPAPEPEPAAVAPPPPPIEPPVTQVGDDRTFEERRADVEAALRAGQTISRQPEAAVPGGGPDPGPPRRRSRRGGRRHRRHSAPAAG
ncbi:MAG TPA: hypothetical protein VFV05_12965 [Methylomirabilota bacterium]|nr:hypothetical protein [Methylomirabilota bacterium]